MSNKYAPMVKKITSTTIKLTPLDISINDYLSDIFEGGSEKVETDPKETEKMENEYSNEYVKEMKSEEGSRPTTSKGKRQNRNELGVSTLGSKEEDCDSKR